MTVDVKKIIQTFLFCFVYVSFCESAHIQPIEIKTVPVSPLFVDDTDDTFFSHVSSGNHVIAIGEKAYLQISPSQPTFTTWSIIEKPTGSSAKLLITDASETTSFIPDRIGWYEVAVQAESLSNDIIYEGTKRILSAAYAGVGGLDGSEPLFPECARCHQDIADHWRNTDHANVLKHHLNGERTDQYDASCFQCHTLGFNTNPIAQNFGFDDVAEDMNIDLDQLAERANEAYRLRHDEDPTNDIDVYATLPDKLKAKAGVQCESCHGAGTEHFGIPSRISRSFSGNNCIQCHKAVRYDGVPYTYDSSKHAGIPELFQEFPAILRADCGKCHSAQQFVYQAIEQRSDPTALEDVEPFGVTCVACHDPHEKANPHQLRTIGDVVLESGHVFQDGGLGNLCAQCHQSRVLDDLQREISISRFTPHFGPQADVMLGVNAWHFGRPYESGESVHKFVTVDTCVTCHMAEIPEDGWTHSEGALVGGHSFKIVNQRETTSETDDKSNLRNACYPCHLNMTSVDRVMQTSLDYNRNGKREGIQTEIKGMLDQIAEAMIQKYPSITMLNNRELELNAETFDQMSYEDKAVVYNYHLILRDGSFGIHNTAFTIEVLQQTLNQISP